MLSECEPHINLQFLVYKEKCDIVRRCITCRIEWLSNWDLMGHIGVGPLGRDAEKGLCYALRAFSIDGLGLHWQLDLCGICQAITRCSQSPSQMWDLKNKGHIIVILALYHASVRLKYLILQEWLYSCLINQQSNCDYLPDSALLNLKYSLSTKHPCDLNVPWQILSESPKETDYLLEGSPPGDSWICRVDKKKDGRVQGGLARLNRRLAMSPSAWSVDWMKYTSAGETSIKQFLPSLSRHGRNSAVAHVWWQRDAETTKRSKALFTFLGQYPNTAWPDKVTNVQGRDHCKREACWCTRD